MLLFHFLKVIFFSSMKCCDYISVKMMTTILSSNFFSGVVATTDVVEACTGVNIAVMVGGFPRKEGMERKDVMSKNVSIYKSQASALENHAAANCKVLKIILCFEFSFLIKSCT